MLNSNVLPLIRLAWTSVCHSTAYLLPKFSNTDCSVPRLYVVAGIAFYACCVKTDIFCLFLGDDRAFRVFSVIQDQQSRELSQGKKAKRAKELKIEEAELKLPPVTAVAACQVTLLRQGHYISTATILYFWREESSSNPNPFTHIPLRSCTLSAPPIICSLRQWRDLVSVKFITLDADSAMPVEIRLACKLCYVPLLPPDLFLLHHFSMLQNLLPAAPRNILGSKPRTMRLSHLN